MIWNLYCIYDKVAGWNASPFCDRNDGSAGRVLRDFVVGDPAHRARHNAVDYELYYVGEFDDWNGTVESRPRRLVATGVSALQQQELLNLQTKGI